MGRWDIEPAAVQTVVTSTAGVASEFEGQMRSLNSALEGAAGQCSSSIVQTALAGFNDSVQGSITFVFTRTEACIGAAVGATNAYVDGDQEMAANAQSSAWAAPDPTTTMPGRRGNVPQ